MERLRGDETKKNDERVGKTEDRGKRKRSSLGGRKEKGKVSFRSERGSAFVGLMER